MEVGWERFCEQSGFGILITCGTFLFNNKHSLNPCYEFFVFAFIIIPNTNVIHMTHIVKTMADNHFRNRFNKALLPVKIETEFESDQMCSVFISIIECFCLIHFESLSEFLFDPLFDSGNFFLEIFSTLG